MTIPYCEGDSSVAANTRGTLGCFFFFAYVHASTHLQICCRPICVFWVYTTSAKLFRKASIVRQAHITLTHDPPSGGVV
jgi:hypothetical protein